MQELQIAFVSPGTYPPDFGGAQLRLHRTFLRLRRYHMLRVKVLALAGESTVAGWSEVDGIPVRRLPATPGVVHRSARRVRISFAREDPEPTSFTP